MCQLKHHRKLKEQGRQCIAAAKASSQGKPMVPQSGSQLCPTKSLGDALQEGAARGEHAMRELHELKRINHSLLSDCKGLAGQLAQVSSRACT